LKVEYVNYSDLTKNQFFEILNLRIRIFVVEQKCPYQELDEIDLISDHVFGSISNKIISVGRVYKKEDTVFIGRIAVDVAYRKKGYAKDLMLFIIEAVKKKYSEEKMELSAQKYLLGFYKSLGFKAVGDTYLEDGIPHIRMIYFN
jgi:ElaA protein